MLNVVILTGRLTADPELKISSKNIKTCTFSIAVPRYSKENKTDFINCRAWAGQAEFVKRYFRKGQKIEVLGALRQRRWSDDEGRNYSVIEVECSRIDFGESKKPDSTFKDVPMPEYPQEDGEENYCYEELPFT